MSRGKYIVLEGPEGVGKTTQIEELARRLQAAGLPVRTLREPDSQSDLTARALRQLTQDPHYPMNTHTEVLLYNAARSQSLQVIKHSVEQGVICIVDRNYLTTLAVQYYGRGDVPDYEVINKIIGFAVNGVEPDLCIVMDAPVQLLKERAKFRGQGERFDNLDEAFLERVRAGYLWEAKQRDLPVIFATDTPEIIADSIWKLVADTLAIREPSSAVSVSVPQSIKQIIADKQTIPHEPPADLTAATAASHSFRVPSGLSKEMQRTYRQSIDQILKDYKHILQQLKKAGVPQATATAELVVPIIATLQADSANTVEKTSSKMAKLIAHELPDTHSTDTDQQPQLIDYTPRSEFGLLPTALYPYSNLSHKQLATQIDNWKYDTKASLLETSLQQQPAKILRHTSYTFDLILDYASLQFLQQQAITVEQQAISPRYGYAMPPAIETANVSELFERCFDTSLELYSQLQAAGYKQKAWQVALLGHKVRAQLTLSGEDLRQLLMNSNLSDTLKTTLQAFQAAITDTHPLVSNSLAALSVNQTSITI